MKPFRCSGTYTANDQLCSTSDIKTVTKSANPFILAVLGCRGGVSMAPCSPHLNHRDVDFVSLVQGTEKEGVYQPPLRDSCIKPQVGDKFDEMTPITPFMYELKRLEKDEWSVTGDKVIKSSFDVRLKAGTLMPSYLKDVEADNISAKAFRRLLEVFGFSWQSEDGTPKTDESDPPTDFEIAGFIALFDGVDLKSKKGFLALLDQFQLQNMYEFDERTPEKGRAKGDWSRLTAEQQEAALVMRNVGRLTVFLSALVAARVGCSDGNHRFVLETMFLSGCLNPSRVVPLKMGATSSSGMNFLSNLNTNQAFTSQKIRIASVTDKDGKRVEIVKQFATFREAGDVLTTAANRGIASSYREFNDKVHRKLLPKVLALKERHGEAFAHRHYWFPGKKLDEVVPVKDALNAAMNSVVEVIKESPSARAFVSDGKSDKDIEEMLNAIQKNVVDMRKMFFNAGERSRTAIPAIPKNLCHYLHCLRLCCTSPENLVALKTLFDFPSTDIPQRNAPIKNKFRNMEWIRKHIIDHAHDVTSHYRDKAIVEKYILTSCQNSQVDPEFVRKWNNHSDDAFGKECEQYRKDYMAFLMTGRCQNGFPLPNIEDGFIKGVKKIEHKAFGTKYRKTALDDRLYYAAQVAIFTNMVKALVIFGFDPKIREDDKNQRLRLFLSIDR